MPQLIKPGSVKIVSRDGEVSVAITIDLNINLTNLLEGTDLPVPEAEKNKKENTYIENINDKVEWAIPDFGSEKINFGKNK